MRWNRGRWLIASAAICVAFGAWAQAKKAELNVEDQVRQAGFRYYVGTIFGDADEYLKVARLPLYVVRDGVGTQRSEKEARALLAQIAADMKAKNLSDDDRKRLASNMIAAFDQASVQFIGANTAALTFVIRPAAKPEEGDSMGTLILYRKEGRWQVIAEITDSAPIPPDYLK